MKKNSLIKFVGLIILLMTFQISFAQNPNRKRPTPPSEQLITMSIDYTLWDQGDWYTAVTFKNGDSQGPGSGSNGRAFESEVKRNQKVKWQTAKINWDEEVAAEIILISVTRNPEEGGDYLLTNSWYSSQDDGKTIEGQTRRSFEADKIERYIISFESCRKLR